jgi:hypothetical protein
MKQHFFFLFIFFTGSLFISQPAFSQCQGEAKIDFKPGEKVEYNVYYNLSLIWVHAGEVYFETKKTSYQGRKVYFLKSYGNSMPKYDWVYTVRDTFETIVDAKTNNPLHFRRKTQEGGYEVNNTYQYNPAQGTVYSRVENNEMDKVKHDTISLPDCTFDVLSAIYYSRNLDFNKYKEGDKIPLKLLLDGKVHDDLYVRYLGREVIEDREERKWHTIKFSPLLVEGTIFSGGEDMTVWVTDDENKVPVKIEAKVLVGKVKAYIRHAENLAKPLENQLTQ